MLRNTSSAACGSWAEPDITHSVKHDDHDRKKKGDLVVTYKGRPFIIESKSLQTHSIRKDGDVWTGKAQCDASDRRTVKFADGSTLETTCLSGRRIRHSRRESLRVREPVAVCLREEQRPSSFDVSEIHAQAAIEAACVAGSGQLAAATAVFRRAVLADGRDAQDFIFRRFFPAGIFTKTMK